MKVDICGHDVTIVRRKMKNIKLSVKMDGRVVVSAPSSAGMKLIRETVEKNAQWIDKNLLKVRAGQPKPAPGATTRIVGENLLFLLLPDKPYGAHKTGGTVYVHASEKSFDKYAKQFISDKLLEYVTQKMRHYEQLTGLKVQKILIRDMQSVWGNCSPHSATVKFSRYLAYQPTAAIDYVVLHELAHMKYRYHDKAFYGYIARFMPNYKAIKKSM